MVLRSSLDKGTSYLTLFIEQRARAQKDAPTLRKWQLPLERKSRPLCYRAAQEPRLELEDAIVHIHQLHPLERSICKLPLFS